MYNSVQWSCIHLALSSLCCWSFFVFVFLFFVVAVGVVIVVVYLFFFFSDIFFDPKYDRCFCTECHAARGDNLYYTRGKPAKDYGIPIGWCRFGLKLVEREMSSYQ